LSFSHCDPFGNWIVNFCPGGTLTCTGAEHAVPSELFATMKQEKLLPIAKPNKVWMPVVGTGVVSAIGVPLQGVPGSEQRKK